LAHDLKIEHLHAIQLVQKIPELSSPDLSEAAHAYGESIRNLFTLSILLPMAVRTATFFEREEAKALLAVTGKLDRLQAGDWRQRLVLAKLRDSLAALLLTSQETPLGPKVLDEGYAHLRLMLDHPWMSSGVASFLSTILVNAWTAFETLAGDLWEAALNAHPHGLSDLKGKRSRIGAASSGRKPTSSAGDASRGSLERARAVPLPLVQYHNYDLRRSMGSVLRVTQSFDRLDGIREAYSVAFHKNSVAVDAALGDKSLDALSSVRNLIVHRAGQVDREYLDGTKGLPTCPQGVLGSKIALDGELVARLVVPVLETWLESRRGGGQVACISSR
jgi:hypothetical protein